MSEVQVVAAEVLAGAAGLRHAAQGVAGTHTEDELERLSTALEGMRSARSALSLAGQWEAWIKGWEQATSSHQDALVASTEDYTEIDEATATRQRGLLSRITAAVPGLSVGPAGLG